jgi:hypothetical protein
MKNKHIISESKIGSSGLSVLFHNDVCVTLQISHVQLTKISNIVEVFLARRSVQHLVKFSVQRHVSGITFIRYAQS